MTTKEEAGHNNGDRGRIEEKKTKRGYEQREKVGGMMTSATQSVRVVKNCVCLLALHCLLDSQSIELKIAKGKNEIKCEKI